MCLKKLIEIHRTSSDEITNENITICLQFFRIEQVDHFWLFFKVTLRKSMLTSRNSDRHVQNKNKGFKPRSYNPRQVKQPILGKLNVWCGSKRKNPWPILYHFALKIRISEKWPFEFRGDFLGQVSAGQQSSQISTETACGLTQVLSLL